MSSEYVWTGRGGAGNMFSKQELQKKGEDLEAQQTKTTGSANQLAAEEVSAPPPGEYKHMGRGGAGNWFQPSELVAQGTVIADTASTAATPEPATEKQRPVSLRPWRGRGGVGNFAPSSEEAEKEELERMQRQQEEEADVRASVDSTLAKPSQAHLKAWDATGWREAGL